MNEKSKFSFLKEIGVVKIIILAILLVALSLIFSINHFINTRDISGLSNVYPQPTIIYDMNGEVASKISSSKIKGVTIDQIPEHVATAVVAIEDRRFYKHPGVDYIGIFRAMFKNLKARDIVEGGSTITQQLTKNVFLTHEQTFGRKWEEFFIAQKIERTFSKDEIIEMYLNTIYFGEGAWGIRNAAQTYYGKEVHELTLSEGATLAGLIKAPSRLSPVKNIEQSMERRNLVLAVMKDQGFISEQEFNEAISSEIVLQERKLDPYEGKFPYYVDHIIDEATKKYGLTQNEILAGGLHIYTELNQSMQTAVEELYKNPDLFPKSADDQLIQSGSILINTKNGGIHALIGGRGEHVFRGYNRATQLTRQPGSTMKPLAVYTPALEKGYSIYDVLPDQPMKFGKYEPKNFNGSFKGSVTMLDAIKNSDNVPAVWLLNEIGLNAGLDAVQRFGIELTEEERGLPIALGGLHQGVAPLDMAEAYSAFANEGVRTEAHAIQKIVDAKGNVLAEWDGKATRVTTPEVAQRMTYMLHQVVEQGTGRNAKLSQHQLAGKTGSTQVPIAGINGTKDQWFVGYTPDIVGAFWLGYDKTDENHYLTTSSSTTSTVIFKAIMDAALKDMPVSSFNLPNFQPRKENRVIENNKPSESQNGKNNREKAQEKVQEKRKEREKEKGRGNGNNKKGRSDD